MRRHAGGFTLIEVLIALAIVGIALTAALRAGQIGTDGVEAYRERLLAAWLAENVLAERVARREWPEPGSRSEVETLAGRRFEVREVVKITPNPRFRRLDVHIYDPADPSHALRQVAVFLTAP